MEHDGYPAQVSPGDMGLAMLLASQSHERTRNHNQNRKEHNNYTHHFYHDYNHTLGSQHEPDDSFALLRRSNCYDHG